MKEDIARRILPAEGHIHIRGEGGQIGVTRQTHRDTMSDMKLFERHGQRRISEKQTRRS